MDFLTVDNTVQFNERFSGLAGIIVVSVSNFLSILI